MRRIFVSGLAGFGSMILCSCAAEGLFYWGDYESGIYDRMVLEDPVEGERHLADTIAYVEQNRKRVPPGLYADYGFMLYRRGNMDGAVEFFQKEKKTYPESFLLMTRLIDRIREKQGRRDESESTQESGEAP